MSVTAKMYGNFMMALLRQKVNLGTDSIKVMLCTSSYTPNQDTHSVIADVTNEVVGTNYTAGGKVLTGVTLTYDAPTNTVKFDADDISWQNSTITARYAVMYDDTAANKDLICYLDFGQDMISSNGNFPIAWDALGIVTFSTPS